jgi:tryptophan synthase alpha chain
MFRRLAARGEVALIPFVTLGDPDAGTSRRILKTLVDLDVDALELGIPFSDPVADGPVLQAAARRALASGVRLTDCLDLVRCVRARAPDLPIGLLVYANTIAARGTATFYADVAAAGADSVLVADLPLDEGEPFERAAAAAHVAPIYIAPPNLSVERTAELARRTRGYTYVTSRPGVTGDLTVNDDVTLPLRIGALERAGASPAVVGFGISTPAHVRQAREAGARGVIVGSALVRRINDGRVPQAYLRELKEATRLSASLSSSQAQAPVGRTGARW